MIANSKTNKSRKNCIVKAQMFHVEQILCFLDGRLHERIRASMFHVEQIIVLAKSNGVAFRFILNKKKRVQ